MSWTKRIKHPSEVLKKGDTVKARITNIDPQNQRVSLSIKEFMPNQWDDFVAEHSVGDSVDGRVVNVTDFGLFIDVYDGLEGLAHISEIDIPPGAKLDDYHNVGDWVRARILRIEGDERKVGLTMRGVLQPTADEVEGLEEKAKSQKQMEKETRAAAKDNVVVGISEAEEAAEAAEAAEASAAAAAEAAEAEVETEAGTAEVEEAEAVEETEAAEETEAEAETEAAEEADVETESGEAAADEDEAK